MAFVVKDRVRETTTTTGIGTISLGGAVSGYQAFSTVGDGNTTYYTIVGGTQWEVGIGTYSSSGNTLSRTTLISSSTGSIIDFVAGTKDVFVGLPASKAVETDTIQTLTNKTFGDNPTYSGGTANGVAYLNGSKVLTTGSALTFDGSNLGLGVTPSAWISTRRAIQVGLGAVLTGTTTSYELAELTVNSYQDSGGNATYIGTGYASRYRQYQGAHSWWTAPSGATGGAITFTQAMTLDASGNLGIGTSSPSQKLTVSGNILSNAWMGASNTSAPAVDAAIYRPADGTLGFVANAAERMRIDSAGNVVLKTGSLQEVKTALAANDINLSAGNYFTKTISGATSLTVSNVPSSGTAISFILELTNGGSATITWWSGMKWAGGTAPTLTASGRDSLGFYTYDGGTTWNGLVLAKDVK